MQQHFGRQADLEKVAEKFQNSKILLSLDSFAHSQSKLSFLSFVDVEETEFVTKTLEYRPQTVWPTLLKIEKTPKWDTRPVTAPRWMNPFFISLVFLPKTFNSMDRTSSTVLFRCSFFFLTMGVPDRKWSSFFWGWKKSSLIFLVVEFHRWKLSRLGCHPKLTTFPFSA